MKRRLTAMDAADLRSRSAEAVAGLAPVNLVKAARVAADEAARIAGLVKDARARWGVGSEVSDEEIKRELGLS